MIFYQHYRKEYVNPYRTGVKIGNYNEDLFGTELQDKYKRMKIDPKMYISEHHDKYTNPGTRPQSAMPRQNLNAMTRENASGFDLNIDFTNKNLEDYMTLQKKSPFILEDKNQISVDDLNQQRQENQQRYFENYQTMNQKERIQRPNSSYAVRPNYIQNIGEEYNYDPELMKQTQSRLSELHLKDTTGVLNTKDTGIKGNLLFGHGMNVTKDFYKNEFTTTNVLAYDERERTDKFLDPKYKIKNNYHFPPKMEYDHSDWDFRKYRKSNEFSKTFDVASHLVSRDNC